MVTSENSIACAPTLDDIPSRYPSSALNDSRWEEYWALRRALAKAFDPALAYNAMILAIDLAIYEPSAP